VKLLPSRYKKVEPVKEESQQVVINNILPSSLPQGPDFPPPPAHQSRRPPSKKQNLPVNSSPLRLKPEEDVLEDFCSYFLDGETNKKREEAIRFTFGAIEEHFITFQQLKDETIIRTLADAGRAPLGILHLIRDKMSDFKRDYKKVQLASEGVLGIKKAREASAPKFELRRAMADGSEGSDGEALEYFDSN
jgi:hypothetical protein